MEESLDSIKQLIRSVLLSSKGGVKAKRLQGDYQELCGGFIPHTNFGYSTLQDFLASIDDVVKIGRNRDNELTYYAIADKSTEHIQALVSKQKSKKVPKKKAPPSSCRNVTFFSVKPKHTQSWNKHVPVKKNFQNSKFSKNPYSENYENSKLSNGKKMPHSEVNTTFKENFAENKAHLKNDKKASKLGSLKKQNNSEHQEKPFQSNYKKSGHSEISFKSDHNNYSTEDNKMEHFEEKPNDFQHHYKYNASHKKSFEMKNSKEMIHSKKNQLPPRFFKKKFNTDTSKNSLENTLYDNPLGSSPKRTNHSDMLVKESSLNSPSIDAQDAIMHPDKVKNSFRSDSEHGNYLKNLKKLLSIYQSGLHLSGIPSLYKKTYQEDILDSVLDDIVNGVILGYATVEKVNITGDNKYILFPYSDRTVHKESNFVSVDLKLHSALNLGQDYEIIVTYSPTCERIYVQLQSEQEMFYKMLSAIKQSYASLHETQMIKSGNYVITHDYFRAKIISVNKKQVELYKIDFADCTASYWTSLKNVRPMPPAIAEIPCFCVLCDMHRPSNDKSQKWSLSSAEDFTEYYADSSLVLTTISVSMVKFNDLMETQNQHSVVFYKGNQPFKSNINARLFEDENTARIVINNCCDPFEYQPTNFAELPDEEVCNLFVFKVSCTTEVEVCIIGSGFSDKLVELEDKMFEFYSNTNLEAKLPSPPPVNCVYAYMYEDNCTRCRLISIENEFEGTVYLVDNGETETILLKDLRALTDEFIHFPMQSIVVCLAGLDHNALATHCSILQKLNDTVVLKTCAARIVGHLNKSSNKISIVEIFASETASKSMNQICFELVLDTSLIPMLPASDGFSAVSIGNVDVDNSLIFVRLASDGMLKLNDCLAELESSLDRHNCINIYPDKLCLAILPSGMCRVRVQRVGSNDSQELSVYLIDVGTTRNVTRDVLLSLEDETALSIPPQAICCRLCEAISNDLNQKSLSDIANILPTLPVLMKVEQFSRNDDFDIVSLWLNDECKTQIVGRESYRPQSKLSDCTKSTSSVCSRSNSEISEVIIDNTPSNVDFIENVDDGTEWNVVFSDVKNIANFMYRNTRSEHYRDVLSLEQNPLVVQIEDAVAPDCMQIIPLFDMPSRDILKTTLNSFYNKSYVQKEPVDIKINQMYAWHSKSENLWYRVRALSIIERDVSVYLVDYGACKATGRSSLRVLDARFAKMPDRVITAKLSGIRPLAEHNGAWPDNVSSRVRDYLKGKCYLAHVLKIIRGDAILHRDVWEVCLSDMSTPNFWINDLIVDDWNCASYVA